MPDFKQITPHIWRLIVNWDLKIPFFPPLPVAVWLVKNDSPFSWTLIDSGTPEHATAVMDAASRLLGDSQPNQLILTHAHYDHAGGMAEAIRRWAVPVWAGVHEVEFITGTRRYRDIESNSLIFKLSKPMMRESRWGQAVTRTLVEGDTVGDMEVFDVPGHTPGMIALHHKADQAIICGDAFTNISGKLSGPPPFATPSIDAAKQSMQKLAKLDFDTVLISHDASESGVSAGVVKGYTGSL